MKQYCRYCCYLVCGDANYCTEQKRTMSDAAAKSPNRCHNFALNPIDAFGENEKGYQPREQKKTQCDGQLNLFQWTENRIEHMNFSGGADENIYSK